TELPKLPEPRGPKRWETTMFGLVFPLGARAICATWILDNVLDIRSVDSAGIFESCMIGSAIFCCAMTIVLDRRCGFSLAKTLACAMGNLLLGPAGLIVMLGVNEWPAREACQACGKKRLIARRDCTQCGQS